MHICTRAHMHFILRRSQATISGSKSAVSCNCLAMRPAALDVSQRDDWYLSRPARLDRQGPMVMNEIAIVMDRPHRHKQGRSPGRM